MTSTEYPAPQLGDSSFDISPLKQRKLNQGTSHVFKTPSTAFPPSFRRTVSPSEPLLGSPEGGTFHIPLPPMMSIYQCSPGCVLQVQPSLEDEQLDSHVSTSNGQIDREHELATAPSPTKASTERKRPFSEDGKSKPPFRFGSVITTDQGPKQLTRVCFTRYGNNPIPKLQRPPLTPPPGTGGEQLPRDVLAPMTAPPQLPSSLNTPALWRNEGRSFADQPCSTIPLCDSAREPPSWVKSHAGKSRIPKTPLSFSHQKSSATGSLLDSCDSYLTEGRQTHGAPATGTLDSLIAVHQQMSGAVETGSPDSNMAAYPHTPGAVVAADNEEFLSEVPPLCSSPMSTYSDAMRDLPSPLSALRTLQGSMQAPWDSPHLLPISYLSATSRLLSTAEGACLSSGTLERLSSNLNLTPSPSSTPKGSSLSRGSQLEEQLCYAEEEINRLQQVIE
eukprot:gene4252-14365_t